MAQLLLDHAHMAMTREQVEAVFTDGTLVPRRHDLGITDSDDAGHLVEATPEAPRTA